MAYIKDNWDAEHGIARCVIGYTTKAGIPLIGIGIAECHPEDTDCMSQLTGGIIAEYRAEIDLLKKINNYEIKPGISALKHVYCTMRHSKRYNEKSYEAIRLKKELAHLMDELEENNNAIKELKEHLATYIENKEKLYQKIRKGQK